MEVLVEQQANGQWCYNHRLPEAQSGRPDQFGGVSGGGAKATDGRTRPSSGGRSATSNIGPDGKEVDQVRFDPSGWPLAIGPGWFRDVAGVSLVPSGDRRRVLPLVGRAIAHPDQIRLRWIAGTDGTPMLFRRYIARVDGLLVVVDVGKAGWRFATERDPGFSLARLATGALVWPVSK